MCSVVTAYDFEYGRPSSNPEWGPIYYKVVITAQGLPGEPSSFLGSTLGTRAAEHFIKIRFRASEGFFVEKFIILGLGVVIYSMRK